MVKYRFEVALSFAGENRELVRQVAQRLRDALGEKKVFYDEWFEAELAGPDAQIVLQGIYGKQSRLVVPCVSKRYNEKPWTQDEWRAIQALERELRDASSENIKRLRILPLRFGDGEVDGIFSTAIVPDVRQRSPHEIADLILARLELTKQKSPRRRRAIGSDTEQPAISNPTAQTEPAKRPAQVWNVPNLPPNFLSRPEDLEELKTKLLQNQSVVMTGRSASVAVQGMGGIGKTTLATAVARDETVQQAFPDGVFWLTVGQEPKLLELQTSLARALGQQPEFSTVEDGKIELKTYLQGKKCLLVLDDVWKVKPDLEALNIVEAGSQLLVTTRSAQIGTSLRATNHRVDVLNQAQARQLLAQSAALVESDLPPEANEIIQECGCLPLALAMVGAMLQSNPDRWDNYLNKLKSADLEKIEQEFPDYPYPNLFKAIQVSVDMLKPELRKRYLDFAVFPEDTAIPEAVLQTFWELEGLNQWDSQDAIDDLAKLSLLQRDDQKRITLHDLQRDFVRKKTENLTSLHQRWLDAYQKKCSGEWHTGPNDGYFFEWLPYHLNKADRNDDLRHLLLNFCWLQHKLEVTTESALLTDYQILSNDTVLNLVQGALRLSAHVLCKNRSHLAERLIGHLLNQNHPEIQQLLTQGKQHQVSPWLRPLTASLSPVDGPLLRTLDGHSAWVNSVAFSPDGQQVISASDDRTLKLWDISTGSAVHTFEGHSARVSSVAFSPDGQQVISASEDRTLKLWDMATGSAVQTFEGHSAWVNSVAFSPDGQQVISASDDRTLKLWDISTGSAVHTFEGHSARVSSVVFSPDGQQIISASDDCTLKLWDISTGSAVHTFEGHSARVSSVAFSPDGQQVISASDDCTLKLWDISTGNAVQTFEGHSARVSSVAFSPDGQQVISASDRTVKLWDISTGNAVQTFEGHSNSVNSVVFSPDGQQGISASNDRTVKLWDIATGRAVHTFQGHSNSVTSVAFSPNSQQVISASDDRTVKLWDIATGRVIQTFEGHSARIFSVVFSPDGQQAISASEDDTLKLWDIATGRAVQTFEGHSDRVWSVAYSPDGQQVISASDDRTVKLWDIATGSVVQTFEGHIASVNSVAYSPDGQQVISASDDRTLKLWDIATGNVVHTFEGHSASVNSAVFSPDGQEVISASDDCTVKLWDIATGRAIQTFEGHSGRVNSVVYSPDGQQAISASADRTLKLWDVKSCQVTCSFTGDHSFFCCAVAPDGVTVVAGDRGGWVHFLRIENVNLGA